MGLPGSGTAGRPICTICYEDLKPITEDLQVIPNCGHVFHELCLQQWLEYCPVGKRPTCPFCKGSCPHTHPTRLYFQSTGDPTQIPSSPQRHSPEHNADELAEQVRRLEAKISSLMFTIENQQTHLKKLNDELLAWKESAKAEETKNKEIKKGKELADQLLQMKLEELTRKSSECSKLEQRSLGLAKELAALKLATDLNLGEEEIAKLASLGHGGKPENEVVVLRKSLALRNKSYKELMAQCNLLGRAENRTSQKLDKANEKIRKFKTRLHELEKTFEEKENGTLRDLKTSYNSKAGGASFSCAMKNLKASGFGSRTMEVQTEIQEPEKTLEARENGVLMDFAPSIYKKDSCVVDVDNDSHLLLDEDALDLSPNLYRPRYEFQKNADQSKFSIYEQGASFPGGGSWCSGFGAKNVEKGFTERSIPREEIKVATWAAKELLSDSKQTPPLLVRKEAEVHDSVTCAGDPCFPCGLLGLESSNRSVGKWSRHSHSNASSFPMPASTSKDSLIAVGADGRGGRVKVLRTHDRLLDGKAHTLWPKRQKQGAKQSGQSQIEHFFGRT